MFFLTHRITFWRYSNQRLVSAVPGQPREHETLTKFLGVYFGLSLPPRACSASHTKTSLVGTSLCIPITDGRLNLGTWQGTPTYNFQCHQCLTLSCAFSYLSHRHLHCGFDEPHLCPAYRTARLPRTSGSPSVIGLDLSRIHQWSRCPRTQASISQSSDTRLTREG